jgi:hypothetical protein
MRSLAPLAGLAVGFALLLAASVGHSADKEAEAQAEDFRRLNYKGGSYARILVALAGGRGFRFNNPFRLQTQLGDTEQSVSLTAPYVDSSIAATFGNPFGLQHGGYLRLSIATEGVPQQAVALGYTTVFREGAWLGYGRLGLSLLTAPDSNAGGELALAGAYFLSGALGLHVEAVGNFYYGAASYDTPQTPVPVLSVQGGLLIDFEVLP